MSKIKSLRPDLSGLRVLVVDDEEDIRLGLCKLISTLGATVSNAGDGIEALEIAEREGVDLVLSDMMMPRMGGAELLPALVERFPEARVVILTGFGTIQSAVSCLQNGAAHFMTKPFENAEVLSIVGRLGRQLLAARGPVELTPEGEEKIIAVDPAMRRVMQLVDRVAPSPVPVLVEGESGTGKEVIARAIHERSPRKVEQFLAVNAAALPDTLLESELFGHARGAFTGADRDREGLFRQANGGTVFLDEIASMSQSFQGKLLRVLQEHVVRPLGASKDIPVEYRLIAATNRDLEGMIRSGEFRKDLFYRLGVMRIFLPPLRDRKEDIEPLAMRFLADAAKVCLGTDAQVPELSQAAVGELKAHPWPGNVRELENAMKRAVVVCTGDRIFSHHLGLEVQAWGSEEDDEGDGLDYAASKQKAIERFQRDFVERALESEGGNVSHAASRCGLTRAALQRILRQLDLDASAYREQ